MRCFLLRPLLSVGTVLFVCSGGALAQTPDFSAAAPVEVDSVAVVGNQLFQTAPLLGTIGIFPGDSITYVEIQAAEQRLWATGRFSDIVVTASESSTGAAALTFQVEEYPVVTSRSAEGLESLSASDVWEHIGLTQGLPYSPQLFVEARQFIRDGLAEQGIPFAQVEQELIPLDEDSIQTELVLRVTEGQRVSIADVVFNGNDLINDSELEGAISSRAEGFFWFRTGAFRGEDLEEDLLTRLPEFYASRGYLDFQVLGDTIIIDPATGKARLEIDVSEGPQYRVSSFSVEGNREFPTEELEALYQPDEGGLLQSLGFGAGEESGSDPVFDQVAFEEATTGVNRLYSNSGYLYAQVAPQIDRLPQRSGEEPPRVALTWIIDEGQPAYVRRINIEGNDYTHDRVIRERIQLLPGDVYSEDRLMRSYQAINGLGFFESPLPLPELEPDPETGDIDVTFAVQERSTGSVNFGTTLGAGTGLSGFVGYDQPNLFGQAKAGSFRWDFGRYLNNLTVQYTDPAILQSRISGTISLFNARDRFFSFTTGRRRVVGTRLQVGFPVPGSIFTRFFVGYSISRTAYDLEGGTADTSLFGRPPGLQSQLSLSIARNTLDHPLFPTVGTEISWTTELNGGLLGGDGEFIKHTADGAWWIPVGGLGGDTPASQSVRFTLGLRARVGTITGNAEAFPFDRFWLGGVQFGEPLRGYEETEVTALGYRERGDRFVRDVDRLGDTFMTISAEYALRFGNTISLAAFYEAGGLWHNPGEVDPSRLFRGAGLGIDLVTPFGPFGLDYGYGFDKDVPGWQLHFRMGGQQGL